MSDKQESQAAESGTKTMRLAILCSLAWPWFAASQVASASLCTKLGQESLPVVGDLRAAVFAENAPSIIAGPGKTAQLTFSFDSEIPNPEMLQAVTGDQTAAAALDRLFQPIPTATLSTVLKLSEKQVKAFAVKKSAASSGATSWRIQDLHPRYAALVIFEAYSFTSAHESLLSPYCKIREVKEFYTELSQIFQAVLRKESAIAAPFAVHEDSQFLEINHMSWESVPSKFRGLVRYLHQRFVDPQTHLHLGVPSALVSVEAVTAIGRAVELLIVLDRAALDPEEYVFAGLGFIDGSPLAKVYDARGVVNLKLDAFKEPTLSHDIEIRQYNNSEHGFELLAMAVTLAKRHATLKIFPEVFGHQARDKSTGNLLGALRYLEKLLVSSDLPNREALGAGARTLADKVAEAGVTPELRMEIHRFLTENRILEIASKPEFFLIAP